MKRTKETELNHKTIKRSVKGIWIPIDIWLDNNLTVIEKIFFIEIDSLDGLQGCFASNGYFAKFFQLTPGRCSQIISSLEKKGYIKTQLFMKEKQVIKRVIRVFNKLKGGIKNIKGGYLENDKDNNIIYNNINKDISIQEIIPSKKINKYLPIAKRLSKIISTHKKINCNQNINTWAKPIELLFTKDLKINGYSSSQIKKRVLVALNFYKKHIGEEYIPVIQSGNSFREKFIKLEDAMQRENKTYSKKSKKPKKNGAMMDEQTLKRIKEKTIILN